MECDKIILEYNILSCKLVRYQMDVLEYEYVI
jgi:hypothetical protein